MDLPSLLYGANCRPFIEAKEHELLGAAGGGPADLLMLVSAFARGLGRFSAAIERRVERAMAGTDAGGFACGRGV